MHAPLAPVRVANHELHPRPDGESGPLVARPYRGRQSKVAVVHACDGLCVARDPRKNHGLVLVAALGKTCVALLWIAAFAQGTVGLLGLAGALGDLVFAALFFRFLLAFRTARAGVD